MEGVLTQMGFRPRMWPDGITWEHEAAGIRVRGHNVDELVITRMVRFRTGGVDTLRALVKAELACAAAWRGEDTDSKETT